MKSCEISPFFFYFSLMEANEMKLDLVGQNYHSTFFYLNVLLLPFFISDYVGIHTNDYDTIFFHD